MSVFNRDYNVIFIHVPKTAGTSMERNEFLGWGGHDEITRFMDQPGYEDAWKFAFVRNPWDRYVSAWAQKHDGQFVQVLPVGNLSPRLHFRPQHEFICDQAGNILVDFVGRFERLQADWRHVCDQLGVRVELAHHRPGNHRPYREYYTPETWEQVAEMYARDIEIFGYHEEYGGST
jgi:chondroitin 4-sulfotransferase 11